MAFNITTIMEEVASAPSTSPLPDAVAWATLTDVFTEAGVEALTPDEWAGLSDKPASLGPDQVRMLAWFMTVSPSLRETSVSALGVPVQPLMASFLEAIEPLTAEMIRANRFRQEEFLRRWASVLGAPIEGESKTKSRKRLSNLNYKKTQVAYRVAKAKGQAVEEARKKALEAARKREVDSRGWRE